MVANWLRRRPLLVDVAIVLALAAGYFGRAAHFGRWTYGFPIAAVEVLPLLVRRRYPSAVLAVVSAATLADVAIYGASLPVAVAVAIYTSAAHLTRRVSVGMSAANAAAIALLELVRNSYHPVIGTVLLFVAAWVVGDSLGTRRAYLKELELRAERLEREQEAEAARAVAEEQARIARELHDVIAHNVSVMVVHAAAGRDAFEQRPQRAREALETIESTGRVALSELRRLLGAVRDGEPGFEPQPSLDQLPALLDRVRASGLEVVFHVEGRPLELSAAVELSAYRIVQEALTNTLKHAAASRVDVRLRYDDSGLGVEVRDNGRATGNGAGTGSGLIGMRERVTAFGGALSTGPAPGGGYAVDARFPL